MQHRGVLAAPRTRLQARRGGGRFGGERWVLSPRLGATEPRHPGGKEANPGVPVPPRLPTPSPSPTPHRGGWRRWRVPAVTPRVGTSPCLVAVAPMAARSLHGCHGDVPALTNPSKH